jgi:hypothetical protein
MWGTSAAALAGLEGAAQAGEPASSPGEAPSGASPGQQAPGKATTKPSPAAQASFEDLLKEARSIASDAELSRTFEPLFADCRGADELEARQCQGIRQYLESQLHGQTFAAVGDSAALGHSPYDPSSKLVELDVQGCIACAHPVQIGDHARFVTTRIPKAIKAGKATGLDVAYHEVAFPDPKTAARWERQLAPRLRVQFVFRLGPVWKSGQGDKAYEGLTFVPIAHRIYDACNGQVAASDPPSAASVQVDRAVQAALKCPAAGEDLSPEEKRKREEWEALPVQLSPKDVERAMAPVQEKVHDCFVEFEEKGTAKVRMTVDGQGKLEEVAVLPPFDRTPTGYCVRAAVRTAEIPHFKGEKMQLTFPFYLR